MDDASRPFPFDRSDMGNKENFEEFASFTREGTPRSDRHKSGGATNLRKSLAWNNAFFTDEGILNPIELSVLSRSKTKFGRNLRTLEEEGVALLESRELGNESSGCRSYEDRSRIRSELRLRRQSRGALASKLLSEATPSTTETPRKALLNQTGCKTSTRSSVANSQKRLAHACPTNPVAKFQKIKGNLVLPKAPKCHVQAERGSHSTQNSTPAHIPENESRKNMVVSTKKVLNSEKSSANHSDGNLVAHSGSSSNILPRPLMITDLHKTLDSAGDDKIGISSLSANKVNLNPHPECSLKPSALRMPSPSQGFFVQGKSNSSHAMKSQKYGNTGYNTNKNIQTYNSRHVDTLLNTKTVGLGLGIMNRTPEVGSTEGTENKNRNSHASSCDVSSVSGPAMKPIWNSHPSTAIMESSDCEKSCCQLVNKDIDNRMVSDSNKAHGILDVSIKPKDNSQKGLKDINVGNVAIQMPVTNVGIAKHVAVHLEASLPCVQLASIVSQEEGAGDRSVIGFDGSLSNLSDGARYSSLSANHKVEVPVHECLASVDGQGITFPRDVDAMNSVLMDDSEAPVYLIQCPKRSDTTSSNQNLDATFPAELSCCTPSISIENPSSSSSSINSKRKNVDSACKDHCGSMDPRKEDALKLKFHLKAQPFSEEWIAALEKIGEDILKIKTGAVQNSPPDKPLPDPSPWSPVKKNLDLGPYDCTKYTKDKFPSST